MLEFAKVSVVIPNYNHSKYLEERIHSILSQTYQYFELIILDDFSTDNSREVIERFRSHPKVSHVLINEKNSGSTFKQWKKGVELANGELIWIAESDDWCEHTFLENLVKPFSLDPQIVVSYSSSLNIRNNIVEGVITSSKYYENIFDGENWRKLNLLDQIGISNASSAVFKKSEAAKINFDDIQSFKLIGDRLFWFQLANLGKVHTSGRFLNYCRRHGNNVTENRNREGIGFIEYIRFLEITKQSPSYSLEVEHHVQRKVLDNFIYMEQNNEFTNSEVRDKVFGALNSSMPEFKSLYNKQLLKYKLNKLKKYFVAKLR